MALDDEDPVKTDGSGGDSLFATNLRRVLARKEVRPAQLARELELSSSAVNQWLHGRTVPSARRIAQIAAAIGVQASEIMGPADQENTKRSVEGETKAVRIPELPMHLSITQDDRDRNLFSLDRTKASGYEWEIPKHCLSGHTSEPFDLCVVRVPGNSMSPEFRANDYILVDLNCKEITSPGVYLIDITLAPAMRQCTPLGGKDAGKVRLSDSDGESSRAVEDVGVIGRVIFTMLVPR
jgi:transcriptional regulator with XRE-family HTH domain